MTDVEVLYFVGCPNHAPTVELVREVVRDVAPDANVLEVEVSDFDEAQRMRFLGSPTVRVDGRDVEPGAEDRTMFQMACRLYRPRFDENWLREALLGSQEAK